MLILSETVAGILNMVVCIKKWYCCSLDIIQIVPFTILPSATMVLVTVGIKWLTHKMSYAQEEICRNK